MSMISPAESRSRRLTVVLTLSLSVFAAVGAVLGSLSYKAVLLMTSWSAVAVSSCLLGGLLGLRRLTFERDWFFILGYLQAIVYLHLAPTLAFSASGGAVEGQWYVFLQGSSLLLFEVPFLLVYLQGRKRLFRIGSDRSAQPELDSGRHAIFVLFCVAFASAYLAVVLKNDLLFRRLGHAFLAARVAQMPLTEFAIYRLFGEAGLLFVGLLAITTTVTHALRRNLITFGALLFVGGAYFLVELINSRYSFLIAIGFGVGIIFLWMRPRFSRLGPVLGLAVVLALYSLAVSGNFRSALISGGDVIVLSNFNPFAHNQLSDSLARLSQRLNGVDLMVKLSPSALDQGFAWGRAWRVPVVVTFGQFVSRQGVAGYKLGLLTNAKSYLLDRYTTLPRTDYPSCMLTDVYGNFFVLGFLPAAAVWAVMLNRGTGMIQQPQSKLRLVIGLVLILSGLRFEKEFINLLVGWVRMLPVALLLVPLCPLKWTKKHLAVPYSAPPSASPARGD